MGVRVWSLRSEFGSEFGVIVWGQSSESEFGGQSFESEVRVRGQSLGSALGGVTEFGCESLEAGVRV